MKVKFYGTRGSIPVCEAGFQEFGGNTTCVLVIGPDRIGILDAGSGIRQLGKEIENTDDERLKRPILIALSHFHWDHIQGFPFFLPAYDPEVELVISAMGRGRLKQDLKTIFASQMEDLYFPVSFDALAAQLRFHSPDVNRVHDGGLEVIANRHQHPGGAYGYRIESGDGTVLTFCTDVEHGETLDQNVIELARGADLLIHDGQYTPEELEQKRGWGHSSWLQAIEVAEQAGAKRLAITHHDPDHDDEFLRRVEEESQQRFPGAVLARDGMEIDLTTATVLPFASAGVASGR